MPQINTQSPFPTFGELYRILANALDVNQKQVSEIGRLAREGEYKWSVPEEICEVIGDHLTKYLDQDFSDCLVSYIYMKHNEYMALILNTQVDALNRKELIYLLKDELVSSIHFFLQEITGSDLKLFTSPDHNSFKVVLDWIQKAINTDVDLIKYVYPDATHHKEKRRNIERWCSGEHLPDLSSINNFAKELSERLHLEKKDNKEKVELMKRWLLLARVLENFSDDVKGYDIDFKKLLKDYFDDKVKPIPLQNLSYNLNLENQKQGQRLVKLQEPRYLMLEQLNQNEYFVDEAQKKSLMVQLENLKATFHTHDSDGRTYYELERIYGRYYLLCGDFKKASIHYDESIRLAWYRAGQAIKPLFEEVLYFYAHIGKITRLKQLRHRGVALGLLKSPSEFQKINFTNEELDELKDKFRRKFPNVA